MSDLNNIAAVNRTIDILRPDNGEPVGLRIEIRPETSREVKAQQRKNTDKRLNSQKKKLSAAWIEESYQSVLLAAVAGWEWGTDANGEPANFRGEQPECTPDNVQEIFKALPWVAAQVREAFEDTEAFFVA